MSKRAKEAAMKAYPVEEGKVYSTAFGTWEFDQNAAERKGFQEGYDQAEKDIKGTLLEWAKNIVNLYELPLNGREPSKICLSKAEAFRLVINKIESL